MSCCICLIFNAVVLQQAKSLISQMNSRILLPAEGITYKFIVIAPGCGACK